MRKAKYTLEDAVLEVCEYACQQQDFEVAAHLLRALELLPSEKVRKTVYNRPC